MSEKYTPTVKVGDQVYDPEMLAENSERILLVTGENSYNLGEVELELRGKEKISDDLLENLRVLEEVYEEKYPNSSPSMVIRDGKGPGHPIVGDKLENITDHLEPAAE